MTIEHSQTKLGTQSVTSILKNTSDALGELHDVVQDIEWQILEMSNGDGQQFALSAKLQSIDILSQSVQEIANLMERVAAQLPTALKVDTSKVVEPIRLELLRNTIARGLEADLLEREKTSDTSVSLF